MKIYKARQLSPMKLKAALMVLYIASMTLLLLFTRQVSAQDSAQSMAVVSSTPSRRYENNQTFVGRVYRKDNNVWIYTKEFADLFGMPGQYIGDVQGIAAAAFRIEDTSIQECGFLGRADACRRVEECLLDLYFDESKTPLPWATEIKTQWRPSYSSMIWLRSLNKKERPHGNLAVDPTPGVIRNESTHSSFIPFADPVSKLEAIFTTNANTDRGGVDAVSHALSIEGYMRNFYRNLSVVNIRFGCGAPSREDINIRLDAIRHGIHDIPVARFNRIYLPKIFAKKISERTRVQKEKNPLPYSNLLASPIGSNGTQSTDNNNQ